MKEDLNMTTKEKLSAFVDGELQPEDSGNLFYEIASNQELQNELRELILIKNALKNLSVTPPTYLKDNILNRTVYSNNLYTKLIGTLVLLWNFILGHKLSIASLLILFSGIIYFTFIKNDDIKNNHLTEDKINLSQIPEVSSLAINQPNEKINYLNDKKINKQPLKSTNPSNSSNNQNIIRSNQYENLMLDKENIKLQNDNIYLINKSNYDFSNANILRFGKNNDNFFSLNSKNRFLNKFSFNFRNFDGISYPNFVIENSENTLIKNFSIGLTYHINFNHSIGICIANENFLMEFTRYDNDILYNYKQNVDLFWYGLTYNYLFDELFDTGFRPDVSFIGGINKLGPIIKVGTGLNYYFTDYFSMRLGIEAGTFIFSNGDKTENNKIFSTTKIGYNLGLNIGL